MRTLALVVKGIIYLILIAITAPALWWLGRSTDGFEDEMTVGDFDPDDPGEEVDES